MIPDALLGVARSVLEWVIGLVPDMSGLVDCSVVSSIASAMSWVAQFVDVGYIGGVVGAMVAVEAAALGFRAVVWVYDKLTQLT